MGGRLDAGRRQDRDLTGRHSLARRWPSRTGAWPTVAAIICGVAALASILPLADLAWLALPTGDDFCYAAMHLRDVWPFLVHVYLQQGGRWSTPLVEAVTVGAIPDIVTAYPFLLVGFLAIRLASAYVLSRAVLHPSLTRARCAIFAGSFCLLYWCAMPSIGDSMFWMTGAFFYELTASGMLLFLAGLLRGSLTLRRTVVLSLAAILLAGAHEVAGFAVVAIVMGGCALAIRERSANRTMWLALLAASLTGLAIALAAPGNFVRAQQLGDSHGAVHTLMLTGSIVLGRIPRWILDPPLLLAALAVLLDPDLRLKAEWTGQLRGGRLMAVAFAAGVSILIGFVIPAWASNGLMPGRLLNWQYLVLLTGLLAMLLLFKSAISLPDWVQPAAATAAFLAMLFIGNPRLAADDLAHRVPLWSRAKREALASISLRKSYPRLPEPPHMYFDYDVSDDPSDHPNVCVARYYALPSVVGPRPRSSNGADLSGRSRLPEPRP